MWCNISICANIYLNLIRNIYIISICNYRSKNLITSRMEPIITFSSSLNSQPYLSLTLHSVSLDYRIEFVKNLLILLWHKSMILLKVVSIGFLLSLLFVSIICQSSMQTIYVKAAQCNASSKYIYENFTCFAKSYNRNVSTVNFLMTFKKPLNDFNVSKILSVINYLVRISFTEIGWGFTSLQIWRSLPRDDPHSWI